MTLYSNFTSNAIESVETKENAVFITYSSNLEKNYEYNCTNVPEFTNNYVLYLLTMSYNVTQDLWDVSYNNQGEILFSLINSVVITGVVNTNPWLDIITITLTMFSCVSYTKRTNCKVTM